MFKMYFWKALHIWIRGVNNTKKSVRIFNFFRSFCYFLIFLRFFNSSSIFLSFSNFFLLFLQKKFDYFPIFLFFAIFQFFAIFCRFFKIFSIFYRFFQKAYEFFWSNLPLVWICESLSKFKSNRTPILKIIQVQFFEVQYSSTFSKKWFQSYYQYFSFATEIVASKHRIANYQPLYRYRICPYNKKGCNSILKTNSKN